MKRLLFIIALFALAFPSWGQGFQCPDTLFTTYHQPAVGGTIHFSHKSGGTCQEYILTATPDVASGYEFVCWEDGSTTPSRDYTYTGGDLHFRAVFGRTEDLHFKGGNVTVAFANEAIPVYALTANDGQCGGTFSKWNNDVTTKATSYNEGDGQRYPLFDYVDYLYRTSIAENCSIRITPLYCGYTLEAVPGTNYHFIEWTDDHSMNPIRDVDYLEASYTANFTQGVAMKDGSAYSTVQSAVDNSGSEPVVLIANSAEDVNIAKAVTMNGQNYAIDNLTITNTGDLTLSGDLTTSNLYLTAQQGASSQLRNAANLTYDNAYVDIRLEPVKEEANTGDKYYAIGVPFQVEVPAAKSASTAITRLSAPSTATTNQSDYVLWAYDGELRASSKLSGWTLVEDDVLQPGQFYMFGVNQNDNIWRFKKKANTPLGGDATLAVAEYPSDCPNKGWNGLANTQLVYSQATISGIDYAQTYDNGSASGKYEVAPFEDVAYVMGGTFFIQALANGTLTLTEKGSQPYLRAPMRESDNKVRCRVELSNATQHDVLYLTARDEATTTYQVGKDVIKMLGGGADSYIWANDYGYTLCANDKPWVDSVAEFSITMYASQAGEYTLTAPMGELYFNGAYQANLALGAYTLHLNKAYNTGYTIRLGEPELQPEPIVDTPTGLGKSEEVRGEAEKFIYNNTLYIRQNGRIYNAQGGEVR